MPKYTPELVDLILSRLASGVLLAKILRMEDVDIDQSTFYDWKAKYAFGERYEAARLHGYDAIASDSLDIIDGLKPVEGVPNETSRDTARANHRLRLLARFDPARFGERVQVAGADGSKLEASPLVLEVMALLRPQTALEAAPAMVLPTRTGLRPPLGLPRGSRSRIAKGPRGFPRGPWRLWRYRWKASGQIELTWFQVSKGRGAIPHALGRATR
jgi:hypothetical protein